MKAVELKSVRKSFSDTIKSQSVLEEVNLSIEQGEYLSIIGRSGSGKSTLLNLIAGLDRADSGSIQILSEDMSSLNIEQAAAMRLRKIGLVFQFFNLLPTLSLLQNVSVPGQLKGDSGTMLRDRALAWLDVMGIADLAPRLPHEVSGGELQRAAIARALINDPEIILADEPTGNLDIDSSEIVLEMLENVAKKHGKTLLVVTHDAQVQERAHVVYRLERGVLSKWPS